MAEKLRLDVELNINQSKLNAQTREVIRKARSLDREFNKIGQKDFTGVSKSFSRAEQSITGITQQASRATGALSDMGSKAKLTAQRFIIYNVIAGFFFKLTGAINEGVGAFIKFDAAINRAEQILNPLTTDINELRRSVFDLGNEFGVTTQQVQAAQETFIRQGLALKEANELTRASLALSAASAIDAAQATEALTSVLRQFSIENRRAMDVTDAFTAVSINFAATTTDLAEGINRAGSAAATVGVTFEELAGFIAAAQESTRRGGRVIGTGLRTIFTRIFRTPAIDALEELGIRTRETSGEFRTASALLTDLSGKFQTLSSTQQLAVASTISGQRQIATLLALLRNWERGVDATNIALNSQGTALELTRKRQQSVEAQMQRVINNFVEFGTAVGNVFSGDIIQTISAFGSSFEFLAGIVGSLSGSGIGGFFESGVGALSKMAILMGLQAIGAGKVVNAVQKHLTVDIGITRGLAGRLKLQRLVVNESKRQLELTRDTGRAVKLDSASLSIQTQLKSDQLKVAQLNNKELLEQSQLAASIVRIETELQSIKRATLELQVKGNELERVHAKESANTISQLKKEAQLRGQLDKLRLSPESKGNRQDTRLALGTKLIELEKKAAAFGIQGAEARRKIAKELLAAESELTSLAVKRTVAEGLTGVEKSDALESNVIAVKKQEGVLTVANNSLRKQGLLDAVNLELDILRVKAQALALAETEAKRVGDQRKVAGDLGRISQANSKAQAEFANQRLKIEQEMAQITAGVALSQTTIIARENTVVKLRSASVTRQQTVLNISKQIADNQVRLNKTLDVQNKKIIRGGVNFKKAFGVGLLTGGIVDAMKAFGDESDKSFSAATEAVEGFGGALTTLAIAGGPLGVILFTIQAVITLTRYFQALKTTAADSMEGVTKDIQEANNVARILGTSISTLSQLAEKSSLGKALSIEDFETIDKTFLEISEGANIAAGAIVNFKNAITDAAQAGDIGKLNEEFQALQRAITLQKIQDGTLLDSKKIKEAVTEYDKAKFSVGQLQERLRGINGPDAGVFGIRSKASDRTRSAFTSANQGGNDKASFDAIRETWGGLTKDIKETEGQAAGFFDVLTKQGGEALRIFNQLADPTKSFGDNLSLLGQDTVNLLNLTRQLNGAWDIYIRKQGLVRTASLDALVLQQNEAELAAISEFSKGFEEGNGDIRSSIKVLDDLGISLGRAAELGFQFKENFTDTEAYQSYIDIIAEANNISHSSAQRLLEDGKNLRKGITLQVDENRKWALVNKETGTTIQLQDKAANKLAQTLKGNVIPVGIKLAGVQESVTEAFLRASLVVESFEARLAGSTRRVERQTESLNQLRAAVSETESNMTLLKDVMAESTFREPIAGIDSLTDSVHEGTLAISVMSTYLQKFDDINAEAAIGVSNTLRRALDSGADGAALFTAQISASVDGMEIAKRTNQQFLETMTAIKGASGGGLGFAAKELETLIRQRGLVEELAQSLQGLVAFRDKLEASSRGSPILQKDRESAEKFLESIKTILPGVDIKNIKRFIDFSGKQKGEIIGNLNKLFQSIKVESQKIADPVFKEIVANFGQAIQEATEAASSSGSTSLTRTLSNALNKDVDRFVVSTKAKFDQFVKAVGEFGHANQEQLRAAINLTEKRLSELSEATAKGSFLPDFTGDDINLVRNAFTRIRVAVGKEKQLLENQLAPIKERINSLIALEKDFSQGNLLNRSFAQANASAQELKEKRIEAATVEQKLATTRVTERNVTGSFIKQLGVMVDRFTKSQVDAFKSTDALIAAEVKVIETRTSFLQEEATTFEKRVALIEAESSAIESLTRDISGIGDADVSSISKRLSGLTEGIVEQRLAGANSVIIAGIENQIGLEQRKLSIIQSIDEQRISSLKRERDLVKEQAAAVRSLGLEFLKSSDGQQRTIIDSARAVQEFFGDLTPESLDSPKFQRNSSRFLSETNDEMRNAVISQLERLKNVGGEVAPGVSAENVLRKLSESVVGAIFNSPLEVNAAKQTELQTRILAVQKDSNAIAQIQSNLSIAALNQVGRSLDAFTAEAAGGTLDSSSETVKEAKKIQETLSLGQEKIVQLNDLRAKSEREYADAAGTAAVQNKNLVNAFSNLNNTTGSAGESIQDYNAKLVGLRDSFIRAEDGFSAAQEAYRVALGGVGDALVKVAVAQAEYSIGLELARRQNLSLVGAFATFRDELSFLDKAFLSQISALAIVGASEQEIASLRVKLAQETLSIIERELSGFRDRALSLFTGDLQPGDVARQAAAAATVADIAAQSSGQALVNELAKLPEQFRKDALTGLQQAPPDTTFDGLSGESIVEKIATAFGGQTRGGSTVEGLQEEAARQRIIIAENSISQLFSARQGVITAQEQLANSKEALQTARASKELAELQLDAARYIGGSTDRVADHLAVAIGKLDNLNSNLSSGTGSKREFITNAAGGSLTGSEVAGLLRSASREKSAMPHGSNLGVFNTSETVLTSSQMSKLRRGTSTTNAAEGTTGVLSSEVTALLKQINERLALLSNTGIKQQFQIDIDNNRRVSVEGLAGLQTALQDIVLDATGELYTREEAESLQSVVLTVVKRLQETGQISAIGT